jgi:hypothetical protein
MKGNLLSVAAILALSGWFRVEESIAQPDSRLVPSEYEQLQEAIDASDPGDPIIITQNGTYVPFTLSVNRLIYPIAGVTATIAASSTGHAATITAGTVRSLRFTGGTTSGVVILASEAEAVLDSCTFERGTSNFGGIGTACCKLTIKNSVFKGFQAGYAITAVPAGQSQKPGDLEEEEDYLCGESGTYLRLDHCRIEGGTVEAFDVLDFDIFGSTFDGQDQASVPGIRSIFSAKPNAQRNVFIDWSSVFDAGYSCPPDTLRYNLFYSNTAVGCTWDTTYNKGWDPLFCATREATVSEYTTRIDTPTLPGQNPWGLAIGWTGGVQCAWGTIARTTSVANNTDVTVLEDVLVPTGKSLTLGQGVDLRFDHYDNSNTGSLGSTGLNELRITGGTLQVNGVNGNKVRFVPYATDSTWYGITLSGAGKLKLTSGEFDNTKYTITTSSTDSTVVEKCIFNDASEAVFYGAADPAYVLFSRNVVDVENLGFLLTFTDFTGVSIANNKLTGTSDAVAGIKIDSSSGTPTGVASISVDTVTAFSTGAGILVNDSDPEFVQNRVTDNKYGFHVKGGAPYIGTTSSSSDNVIKDNTRGIFAEGVGTCLGCTTICPVVRNNLIETNTYGLVTEKTVAVQLGSGPSDKGLNSFINNSTYCIWNRANSSCGNVTTYGNYFGSCTGGLPPTCWSGLVTIGGAECSQPASWGQIGVEPVPDDGTAPLRLLGATPNPTASATTIRFEAGVAAVAVQMEIFDVTGRQVRSLPLGSLEAGTHEIDWDGLRADGEEAATGIYFVMIRSAAGPRHTMKVMVVR